jgi:hypothetical protein
MLKRQNIILSNNKMETQENVPTVRAKKHLRYYDRHKEEILAKRKQKYQEHREEMKAKVLQRYYQKKAAAAPPETE